MSSHMLSPLASPTEGQQEPQDELRTALRTLHHSYQQQATQGLRHTNKRQVRLRVRAETLLLIAGWLHHVEATSHTPRDLAINLTDCVRCLERNTEDEVADAKPKRTSLHACSPAQQRYWQSAQVRASTYAEIALRLTCLLQATYPDDTFPATLSAGKR